MLTGILPVDKPSGFTSFDVVAKLRRMSATRKVGHAGTLDPAATGVLPLFFGSATRFIDLLPCHDKRYTAALQLGVVTDTQDLTGKVLETHPVTVGKKEVLDALSRFEGEGTQLPPMYSAVRQDGVRLYDLARRGVEVERRPRPVSFHRLSLLDWDESSGRYVIDVLCSRGTYVRTLCHDLGRFLGCGGALGELRRICACGFSLESCRTLEELQALAADGRLDRALLPAESAFASIPRLELDEKQARLFQNGVKLDLTRIPGLSGSGNHAAFSSGRFLGLAAPSFSEGFLKPVRLLPTEGC